MCIFALSNITLFHSPFMNDICHPKPYPTSKTYNTL